VDLSVLLVSEDVFRPETGFISDFTSVTGLRTYYQVCSHVLPSVTVTAGGWACCNNQFHLGRIVNPAKTAELIEMPFELRTLAVPRKHVLDATW